MAAISEERKEKNTQAYAALGVGFVCIVIGLPLWWKTTEVYRVSLPYNDIAQLKDSPISYQVDFTVVVFEDGWEKAQLATLGEKLKAAFENDEGLGLNARYLGKIRDAYPEEKEALLKSKDIKDLDQEFHRLSLSKGNTGFTVMVLPKRGPLDVGNGFVGQWRTSFIQVKTVDDLLPLVQHLVRDLYVDDKAMSKIYQTASSIRDLKPDKESMRSLRYHAGYDVTLTLLNPQPDILNARWDIQTAVQEYMTQFIKAFQEYSSITVKSQYLHYTSLSIRPRKVASGDYYTLSQDILPHIINPIEAHLNSHVSTNPHLNFIVYIPTRDQTPLHVLDDGGRLAKKDVFLSPRWGGMMIYNVPGPSENDTLPFYHEVNIKEIMEVVISQLRLLIGINTQVSSMNMNIRQPGNAAVCLWEVDKWLRSRSLENVATASSTLRSLTQLLDQVRNIVINDDIGNEVQRAVSNIEECHKFLNKGKLREAFAASRQAIISSEKAFFDPSLLELLYFPEDQKFAIYIPLFLPISIPVLLSLIQAIKWLKSRNSTEALQNKDKKDN